MAREKTAKEIEVAKQATNVTPPLPVDVHACYPQPRVEAVPINDAPVELIAEPLKKGHKFYALFRGREDG